MMASQLACKWRHRCRWAGTKYLDCHYNRMRVCVSAHVQAWARAFARAGAHCTCVRDHTQQHLACSCHKAMVYHWDLMTLHVDSWLIDVLYSRDKPKPAAEKHTMITHKVTPISVISCFVYHTSRFCYSVPNRFMLDQCTLTLPWNLYIVQPAHVLLSSLWRHITLWYDVTSFWWRHIILMTSHVYFLLI